VTGLTVPYSMGPRREGDPPALYADSSKAKADLNWELQFPEIRDIISTAWEWHRSHPNGYSA
jgi:UDP-glucose 4-epimerase